MNPYDAQAVSEVLLNSIERGLSPNTLYLSRSEKALYLGRLGKKSNVNMEYCEGEGIPVIRNHLGKSEAVLDEDCLLITLIAEKSSINQNVEDLLMCIANGLNTMGLKTEVKGNDIMSDKKVAGMSFELVGDLIAFDGVALIDFDYDFCEMALKPMPEKFINKKASNHREYLTTIKAELDRHVETSEVVSAIQSGFEDGLQVVFEVSNSLTDEENQMLEGLSEKYHSEQWINTGRWSPVKDYGL